MSILMGFSILLALLLVKTRASGTRNGLFEANIDTACITLSAHPAYIPSALLCKLFHYRCRFASVTPNNERASRMFRFSGTGGDIPPGRDKGKCIAGG